MDTTQRRMEYYDTFETLDEYVRLFIDFWECVAGSNIMRCYCGQTVKLGNNKMIYLEQPRNTRLEQLLWRLTQPNTKEEEINQLLVLYQLEMDLTKVERDLPHCLVQYLDFYQIMLQSYCASVL